MGKIIKIPDCGDLTDRPLSPATEAGFTIIEVLIALFILAVSLVTLMGLQSAVISRSLRDSNNLQAMLYARRVLAQFESSTDKIELTDKTVKAAELLTESDKEADGTEADLSKLEAHLKIEDWGYADKEKAMKRISLIVSWGPSDQESLSIYYFVPGVEEDASEGDGGAADGSDEEEG